MARRSRRRSHPGRGLLRAQGCLKAWEAWLGSQWPSELPWGCEVSVDTKAQPWPFRFHPHTPSSLCGHLPPLSRCRAAPSLITLPAALLLSPLISGSVEQPHCGGLGLSQAPPRSGWLGSGTRRLGTVTARSKVPVPSPLATLSRCPVSAGLLHAVGTDVRIITIC